jgi:hypothetical protein
LAEAAGEIDRVETAFMILEQLSADPARGIVRTHGTTPFDAVYRHRTR